jgi:hypothetical protein
MQDEESRTVSLAIHIPKKSSESPHKNKTKTQKNVQEAPTSKGLISGDGLATCHSSSHNNGAGEQTATSNESESKLLSGGKRGSAKSTRMRLKINQFGKNRTNRSDET